MATTLETLLRRDRRIIAVAITVLTALAWLYLLWVAHSMAGQGTPMPDMPGMDMSAAMTPILRAWTATDFIAIFVMWVIMMMGMMTPSAAPMILIYGRVARQSALDGRPLSSTGSFAGGYLLSWTGFSLVAAAAQGLLERAAWLTPMMSAASNRIGGVVLIAAGIYQGTPLKDACLKQCQSPFAFIQTHGGFKTGPLASLRLGVQHGFYCIGCCWALMALLFAGGVMNIAWIAAIAIFVLIEKILPAGRIAARVAGAGLVLAGLWLFV
jgi:predicted metal-binding membrane protein